MTYAIINQGLRSEAKTLHLSMLLRAEQVYKRTIRELAMRIFFLLLFCVQPCNFVNEWILLATVEYFSPAVNNNVFLNSKSILKDFCLEKSESRKVKFWREMFQSFCYIIEIPVELIFPENSLKYIFERKISWYLYVRMFEWLFENNLKMHVTTKFYYFRNHWSFISAFK